MSQLSSELTAELISLLRTHYQGSLGVQVCVRVCVCVFVFVFVCVFADVVTFICMHLCVVIFVFVLCSAYVLERPVYVSTRVCLDSTSSRSRGNTQASRT